MTNEAGAQDPSMPIFNPAFAVFLRRQLVRAVDAYRADGRKLAKLDDAALRDRFLSAFDGWFAAAPDGCRALNDACSEYLIRRQDAPIQRIVDRVVWVLKGSSSDNSNLSREPVVAIALGRWLFAPFMGALLLADRDDEDIEAARRDLGSITQAVLGRSR